MKINIYVCVFFTYTNIHGTSTVYYITCQCPINSTLKPVTLLSNNHKTVKTNHRISFMIHDPPPILHLKIQ